MCVIVFIHNKIKCAFASQHNPNSHPKQHQQMKREILLLLYFNPSASAAQLFHIFMLVAKERYFTIQLIFLIVCLRMEEKWKIRKIKATEGKKVRQELFWILPLYKNVEQRSSTYEYVQDMYLDHIFTLLS